MTSRYKVGDQITIRQAGYCFDEWFISGTVAEVRSGNPPNGRPCALPPSPYSYRLEGQTQFYRECAIVDGVRHTLLDIPYPASLPCVPDLLPA